MDADSPGAVALLELCVHTLSAKKKAAPTSRPEDAMKGYAMKGSKDDRATDSISEE